MRLGYSKSKNATSLYVIESTYIHGKRSTRIVEKLGTMEELSKIHEDPIVWAKEYIEDLNQKQVIEKARNIENSEIIIKYSTAKSISKGNQACVNGGYLFLQDIFYSLGLDKICETCAEQHKIEYDLTEILSRLVYSRILFPGSKMKTMEFSDKIIETSHFELHDIYRALSLLAEKSDFIQSELYQNTKKLGTRNDAILYYDCTNYYFEIEDEDEFRKYGKSKEHRPNPIVQMGLFMDGDGIPLAFNMNPGNTNEQTTLRPLEKKIEKDFHHAKFIICTDSGLCSKDNKLFNSDDNKAFISTQSLKKLPDDLQSWALAKNGWKILNDDSGKEYNLDELESEKNIDAKTGKSIYYDTHFYKTRPHKDEIVRTDENGNKTFEYLDEKIIVTFSLKYKDYLQHIRNRQVEQAQRIIENETKSARMNPHRGKKRYDSNNPRRFIESTSVTSLGEVADNTVLTIKNDLIEEEEKFDGFYCISTNLDDSPETIIGINKKRWEIEACFRIMKTEFSARPVYLSREDRIKAHFLTCFLALVLYRYLEKKLSSPEYTYSATEIIQELKNMNFLISSGNGYIPTYTRTDFTDRLHSAFGFRTDYEIIPISNMKNIIQKTKS